MLVKQQVARPTANPRRPPLTPACETCSVASKCLLSCSRPEAQRGTAESGLFSVSFKKREHDPLAELVQKHVFVVREGAVKAIAPSEEILELFGPGELFGLAPFFADTNSGSVLARSLTPELTVCALPRAQFTELIEQRPSLTRAALRAMAECCLESRLSLQTMKLQVRERALLLLRTLDRKYGARYGQFRIIDIPLTKIDLASMMSSVQESVVRVFSDFKRLGLISTHGKRIIIMKPLELREECERILGSKA